MELNQSILTPELLLLITSLTHFFKYTLHVHKAYKTGYGILVHYIYEKKLWAPPARESWLIVAVSTCI